MDEHQVAGGDIILIKAGDRCGRVTGKGEIAGGHAGYIENQRRIGMIHIGGRQHGTVQGDTGAFGDGEAVVAQHRRIIDVGHRRGAGTGRILHA